MLLLIDADPIVYRCGFAAETTGYHIFYEDAEGVVADCEFWPKVKEKATDTYITAGDRIRAWKANNPDFVILEQERKAIPESLDHCLHIVKQELSNIVAAVAKKFPGAAHIERFVYLTGKENFRDKLATIKPYKGNRDKLHRPVHYEAIRQYMIDNWDAIVINGQEADDAVSIIANYHFEVEEFESFVVATVDKDLDQIPGHHYDYRQHVWYFVGEHDAEHWFYVQALAGDATDNIGGCYKTGLGKAEKVISAVESEHGHHPAMFWKAIVEQYEASKLLPDCPYADMDTFDVALENARLVYMRRKDGEIWQPPELPKGGAKGKAKRKKK